MIKSYEDAPYLVLATRSGLVKKSKLTDFDSNRSGGIVAVNLRDGDELVGAVLCSAGICWSVPRASRSGSPRPTRRCGDGPGHLGCPGHALQRRRSTAEPQRGPGGHYLLVATSHGYSKRTAIEEYSPQGRGGKGILTIQYDPKRGSLVGAVVVDDETELYAITSGGR